METTAQEVVARFGGAPRAALSLASWRGDPRRGHVVGRVEAHVTRVPYRTTSAQINAVCETTAPALGEIKKRRATSVAPVVDWRPDFAFVAVLSHVLEMTGEPFTWQHFWRQCRDDPGTRAMLWDPAKALVDGLVAAGWPAAVVRDAVRWRVGNAYLSFVRELAVVVELRERGLDVRTHPLADAVFRVDAWVGDRVLLIYIGNRAFRDGTEGRKPRAEALLSGASPPCEVVELRLTAPRVHGRVHLPGSADLDRIARDLSGPRGGDSVGTVRV